MSAKPLAIVMLLAFTGLSGCGTLIVAGAGLVIADEVFEQTNGGDGLF